MINAADLKTRTVKELAEMARKQKVLGWHDMRKEELVQALLRQARKAAAKRNGHKSSRCRQEWPLQERPAKNGHSGMASRKWPVQNGSGGGCRQGRVEQRPCQERVARGNVLGNGRPACRQAAETIDPPTAAPLPSQAIDKQALLAKKKLIEKGPKPRSPQCRAPLAGDQGPLGRGQGPGVPLRGRRAELPGTGWW